MNKNKAELNESILSEVSGGLSEEVCCERKVITGICPVCGSKTQGYVDLIDGLAVEEGKLRCPVCDPAEEKAIKQPLASLFTNS